MTQSNFDSSTSLANDRRAAAEAEFAKFDFGHDSGINEMSGWEYTIPGVEMTRKLYANDENPANVEEGEFPTSVTYHFTVIFAGPDSAKVIDAYAITASGCLFGSRSYAA